MQTEADSVVSDMNGLLISDFGSWRHEERDTILTMLTPPNARCILSCLRSLSVEIRKTQLHLSTVKIQLPTAEYLTLA